MMSTSGIEIEPMASQAIRFRRWLDHRVPLDPIPLSNPTSYTGEEEFFFRNERRALRLFEILEQIMIAALYIGMQLVGAIVGAALLAAVLLDQGIHFIELNLHSLLKITLRLQQSPTAMEMDEQF
jgi:hypothetical protein